MRSTLRAFDCKDIHTAHAIRHAVDLLIYPLEAARGIEFGEITHALTARAAVVRGRKDGADGRVLGVWVEVQPVWDQFCKREFCGADEVAVVVAWFEVEVWGAGGYRGRRGFSVAAAESEGNSGVGASSRHWEC